MVAPTLSLTQEITTLDCRPDDEGPVVATLVRTPAERPPGPRAVLSIHGYVDYYFHPHVAQAFGQAGHDFHALDLRKNGRSLRPHQTPWFCRSLSEYYEEITLALHRMQQAGATDITLMGHSMGGLICSLYAAEGAERAAVKRLVLNSPFFEQHEAAPVRVVGNALAGWIGKRSPHAQLPKGLARAYGESLHKDYHGEWEYSLEWKPLEKPSTAFGWLRAVGEGHRRVQAGLELEMPVLLLHSDKSSKAGKRWSEELQITDSVLNVAHMKKYGPGLGRDVTLHEIPGGMHDLFLSREPVRTAALAAIFAWKA